MLDQVAISTSHHLVTPGSMKVCGDTKCIEEDTAQNFLRVCGGQPREFFLLFNTFTSA